MNRYTTLRSLTAAACLLPLPAFAAEVVLVNGGAALTTGDNLDGISSTPTTAAVVEVPGLTVTANTGAANQTLNSLADSFGVDTAGSGDNSSRTEGSESFTFSFSDIITISEIDFVGLGSTAEFVINVGGTEVNIIEADLSDQSADIFTPTGADAATLSNIAAGTALTFSVNRGVVGIQDLTLEVVPEPASLALAGAGLAPVCRPPASGLILQKPRIVDPSAVSVTRLADGSTSAAYLSDLNRAPRPRSFPDDPHPPADTPLLPSSNCSW